MMWLPLFIFSAVNGHLQEIGCEGGDCRWIATAGGTLVRITPQCSCTGTLDLSAMELTSIPGPAFAGLSSVQKLYLNDNKLSSVSDEAFARMTSLEQLHLTNNELTTLPTSVADLTSLRSLNLYDNKLTSMPADVISKLTNLKILNVKSNPLECGMTVPPTVTEFLASADFHELPVCIETTTPAPTSQDSAQIDSVTKTDALTPPNRTSGMTSAILETNSPSQSAPIETVPTWAKVVIGFTSACLCCTCMLLLGAGLRMRSIKETVERLEGETGETSESDSNQSEAAKPTPGGEVCVTVATETFLNDIITTTNTSIRGEDP